jgi:hypothetical protein
MLVYLVYLVFSPLYKLWILKLKHGKDVEILFYPVQGVVKYFVDGLTKNKDLLYYKRKIVRDNP